MSPLATDSLAEQPVELRANWSEDDLQLVFRTAYQQVFGRQGVYASSEFRNAESLLRNGSITVRQFIRVLALSEFYQDCFFHNNSQVRFIELNYKHLLGRAPYDQSEIAYHVDLYVQQGYEGDINSYIDSQEYATAFGDWTVPYPRGFRSQPGQKAVGYPRMFELFRGSGNSDNAQIGGTKSRLQTRVALNMTNSVRMPSSPGSKTVSTPGQTAFRSADKPDNRVYRVEVTVGGVGMGPQIRRSKQSYTIPYDRFSNFYQEIHRRGGKITSIVPV
jgi:phycoerythrocyanin-associated rod linker protein